jgi:uncharacterized protein (TIGR02444 family)
MHHTFCVAVAGNYDKYGAQPVAARATLRQFAVAVHEAEGVAAACVSLQDRLELDVDVLLLAAYVGAVRRQTLTAEQLGTARELVDSWHDEVVRRLRGVRRMLKSGPAPAPSPQTEAVRNEVAKAELDAELIELDVLGQWADDLNTPAGPGSQAEHARAAMDVAVHAYSTGSLSGEDLDALAVIAAAAARTAGGDR